MAKIRVAVSVEQALAQRADEVARRSGTPRSRLYARALEEFLATAENRALLEGLNAAYADFPRRRRVGDPGGNPSSATEVRRPVVIRQGDLYWVDLGQASGSRPALRRPFVVIQNDLFNQSRLATVVVCALTSNQSRAEAPGNVRLPQGEGYLPRDSVVNVTQLFTIDKGELSERIGRIGGERTAEVLRGVRLVLDPRRAVDTGSRPAGPFST